MDVEFRPPPLGNRDVPMKITGAGTVELSEEGLRVKAFKVASSGRGLLLVLGLFGSVGAIVLARQYFGIEGSAGYGVGAAVGVGFLLPAMRKPAAKGEPVEHLFPWSSLSKVYYDGTSECLVAVMKRSKPKGGLYIVQGSDSVLEAELKARMKKR
jgi:hypothetical protein